MAAADFRADIGGFLLIGTSPTSQDRTCVSGQTCLLAGLQGTAISVGDLGEPTNLCHPSEHLGGELLLHPSNNSVAGRRGKGNRGKLSATQDQVMALDTCAVASSSWGMVNAGHVLVTSSSGAQVSWGAGAITPAGGQYRLCWCAGVGSGSCISATEFASDAGQLTIVGVSPLSQHRTCISGRNCILDGISGQDLADGDRLWILDTCGLSADVPRLAASGLLYETTGSGARIQWGAHQMTAAGGLYRLCWCAAGLRSLWTHPHPSLRSKARGHVARKKPCKRRGRRKGRGIVVL